jgi:hypothetical protein
MYNLWSAIIICCANVASSTEFAAPAQGNFFTRLRL